VSNTPRTPAATHEARRHAEHTATRLTRAFDAAYEAGRVEATEAKQAAARRGGQARGAALAAAEAGYPVGHSAHFAYVNGYLHGLR
jgi:hypothetical protein